MMRICKIVSWILSLLLIVAAVLVVWLFVPKLSGNLLRIGADSTATETLQGTVSNTYSRVSFPKLAYHVEINTNDGEVFEFDDILLWHTVTKENYTRIQFDMKYWYKDGVPVSYAVSNIKGL